MTAKEFLVNYYQKKHPTFPSHSIEMLVDDVIATDSRISEVAEYFAKELNQFALMKCKEMASNMKAVDKFGFVSHAETFIPQDLLNEKIENEK